MSLGYWKSCAAPDQFSKPIQEKILQQNRTQSGEKSGEKLHNRDLLVMKPTHGVSLSSQAIADEVCETLTKEEAQFLLESIKKIQPELVDTLKDNLRKQIKSEEITARKAALKKQNEEAEEKMKKQQLLLDSLNKKIKQFDRDVWYPWKTRFELAVTYALHIEDKDASIELLEKLNRIEYKRNKKWVVGIRWLWGGFDRDWKMFACDNMQPVWMKQIIAEGMSEWSDLSKRVFRSLLDSDRWERLGSKLPNKYRFPWYALNQESFIIPRDHKVDTLGKEDREYFFPTQVSVDELLKRWRWSIVLWEEQAEVLRILLWVNTKEAGKEIRFLLADKEDAIKKDASNKYIVRDKYFYLVFNPCNGCIYTEWDTEGEHPVLIRGFVDVE